MLSLCMPAQCSLYMLEFLNVAKSSNGSNQKSTYFRGMKVPSTYSTLNLSMKKMQCKNTLCFVNSQYYFSWKTDLKLTKIFRITGMCKIFFLLYNGEIRQRTQNYSSRPTFVKLFVFVSTDVLCYNMIPKSQILPILLNTKNDGSAFHLHTEALNDLWCFTHFITDDDLNFYTHTHNNPEAKCCPRHDVCVE